MKDLGEGATSSLSVFMMFNLKKKKNIRDSRKKNTEMN